jgi:hypothetical protein
VKMHGAAGAAAYGRIKTFGLEASGLAGGGGGGGAVGGGAAAPAEGVPPTTAAAVIAQIVDAITDAQVVHCPYDGTVFEKDGACTHIDTCPGRMPCDVSPTLSRTRPSSSSLE